MPTLEWRTDGSSKNRDRPRFSTTPALPATPPQGGGEKTWSVPVFKMELIFFIEVLAGGLLAGVMYALVALGFVLIYKASGVFNFAQGSMVFFAALTFVSLLERGEGEQIGRAHV